MTKNIYQPEFMKSQNRWVCALGGTQSREDVMAVVNEHNHKTTPVTNDNLDNLDALEKAQSAAYNEEMRYQNQFERMMESGDSITSKAIDQSLKAQSDKLAVENPRSALYLTAKSYTYSSNLDKYSAGISAMKIIKDGGDLAEAKEILKNWNKSSVWN